MAFPRFNRGKIVKYENPTGSKLVIDVPPAARDHVLSAVCDLFITEGIKKADAAAARGLACVALIGVYGWKAQDDFWRAIPLHGRRVYLVFDSDITSNLHVQKAAAGLFAFLESQGAHPMMVRLTGTGTSKVGLDDYLAAGNSTDDLIALATDEAPAFQETPKIRSTGTYEATGEGIVRITPTKDGPVQVRITNFSARIVSETVFVHGAEITRELEIEAIVSGRNRLIPLAA